MFIYADVHLQKDQFTILIMGELIWNENSNPPVYGMRPSRWERVP